MSLGHESGVPTSPDADRDSVLEVARQARGAAQVLAPLARAPKDAAISAMADALERRTDEVLASNSADVERAIADQTSSGLVDRLTLTKERLAGIAAALRQVVDLPDPVGEVLRGYTLPNGLEVRQVRVPLGVVGIIYEARPNVTVDAAGLGVKSGNAVLLRGSSSAHTSNTALVQVMQDALSCSGLPRESVQLVPGTSHEAAKHLMTARGLVDVLIPRGGAGLISSVVEESTVPVIETGVGNCHVYIDADADLEKAVRILVNSKTQRTSVCNTAETVLVHEQVAPEFLPRALAALGSAGVTIHGDDAMAAYSRSAGIDFEPATDCDWSDEYYSLDIAAAVVPSLDAAVDHIRRWSTGHTEAIVTENQSSARSFVAQVDAAAVMVNASTRFTDGAEFGFGAEIGISTQKLHARGPMGLAELTSTKYVVTGDGQIRE